MIGQSGWLSPSDVVLFDESASQSRLSCHLQMLQHLKLLLPRLRKGKKSPISEVKKLTTISRETKALLTVKDRSARTHIAEAKRKLTASTCLLVARAILEALPNQPLYVLVKSPTRKSVSVLKQSRLTKPTEHVTVDVSMLDDADTDPWESQVKSVNACSVLKWRGAKDDIAEKRETVIQQSSRTMKTGEKRSLHNNDKCDQCLP